MSDLLNYLQERPYPGRGILLGNLPDGQSLCAYFIMGRSENSRNRVFEATEDGIRTKAFDHLFCSIFLFIRWTDKHGGCSY